MIRGGNSMITHRYSQANNKYMKNYDKNKNSKYIFYLDANNLYGWAMSQYLPVGEYKWNTESWNDDKVLRLNDDQDVGYILEVDIEYPKELHDKHNNYPLCPYKKTINDDMLSQYAQRIKKSQNISSDHVDKLICDLSDKHNYVIHYRNLKQVLELGLKVTKFHKVLQFKQEPCMKQYIDSNTNRRSKAKNDFEKDFYKLMNNSVFGKQMENVRKRVNVELVLNNKDKLRRWTSRPTYVSSTIFDESLVALHMKKHEIKLNKPICGGACILDLSKLLMYDFYYKVMQPKYGDKMKLLFTDTDSLTFEIETEDIYKDIYYDKEYKSYFDLSDYPNSFYEEFETPNQYVFNSDEYIEDRTPNLFYNQLLQDKTNKKVIGKFKDETSSIPITEFIGLKAKMYNFTINNDEYKNRGKGIQKCVLKNDVTRDDYSNCLIKEKSYKHPLNTIRSVKHKLYTIHQMKTSLTCFDNKRFILDDGISSYGYGHYLINKNN